MSLFRGPDREELLALRSRVARLEEQVSRLEAALEELRYVPDPVAVPLLQVAPDPDSDEPDSEAPADGPDQDEKAYPEARALAAEGRKIHAIQLVIEESGMSLKAAKDLVDSW